MNENEAASPNECFLAVLDAARNLATYALDGASDTQSTIDADTRNAARSFLQREFENQTIQTPEDDVLSGDDGNA